MMAQSGGFFLHLAVGKDDRASMGTNVTETGALLIATASAALAVGQVRSR